MGLFDAFKKKPAKKPAPRPVFRAGMPPHPDPKGENNFIIVILDSCRWDTFMEAEVKFPSKLKMRVSFFGSIDPAGRQRWPEGGRVPRR